MEYTHDEINQTYILIIMYCVVEYKYDKRRNSGTNVNHHGEKEQICRIYQLIY